MRVAGLDLSLTSTGLATADGVRTLATKLRGVPRLIWLRTAVLEELERTDLVILEGYSFASKFRGEVMGELGGVIRVALWEANIAYVEVPPALMKKYATGRGNAKKEQVLVQAVRRFDRPLGNDEADAAWLRAMGCDHYGLPTPKLPEAQREVLERIEWPLLGVGAAHRIDA